MNHSAFQAILQDKDLRHTQDGQAIAEFVVTIPPLREEDPPEQFTGGKMEKTPTVPYNGDQLILQGQLKITKVTHKMGEEEYVEQQASLIVEKINRIS